MNHTASSPGFNTGNNSYSAVNSPGYNSGNTVGYGRTGRGNLTELDSLLDDLSHARYGNYDREAYNDRNGECF